MSAEITRMDGATLRDGIFSLRTRRFGTVAEAMVKRLLELGKAQTIFHDLYDEAQQQRIEVKFSTVMKEHERTITHGNVLQCIEEEVIANRMIAFDAWRASRFDCNIQQIKKREFEILYYGLFFADCVVIFRIPSGEIDSRVGYSDRQHSGNVGEGQFHVKHDNLQYQLDHYLHHQLTYDTLLTLLLP